MVTAEEWQKNPRRAMEMLQLLISESAPLDNKTETQDRMEMTPLAHAVAGGSLEAVRALLELTLILSAGIRVASRRKVEQRCLHRIGMGGQARAG